MCACWTRTSSARSEYRLLDGRYVCIRLLTLLSQLQVLRVSHGRNPCSEQAYESPAHAPETEQQKRNHETSGRHSRPVGCKVAWIAGDEAHQEGDEEEDGPCKRACQEAEP